MKTSEVLRKAAEFIETRGWYQGWYGRDASGQLISGSFSPPQDMSCACLLGVLAWASRVSPQYVATTEAYRYVKQLVPVSVLEWNDDVDRTKEEVIALLHRAAEVADTAGD